MELAIQIFQFVLSISILVVLHELGHFLPAKWFKTKVEKFYLFFDPWFSVIKKKVGETEYGIGWLPLGGYVKIAGMIDESMDTEQMKKTAELWEFRSKPAWQRLIIMLGGVTVNFFLAWLIFSALSFFNGESYYDNSKIENGIAVTSAGEKMGLKSGDKILKIDGKTASNFRMATTEMLFADQVTVLRDGKEVTFNVNKDGVGEVLKSGATSYLSVRFPAVVDSVIAKTGAAEANLQKGDKIIGFNNKPITYFDELSKELEQNKNKIVAIEYQRNGKNYTAKATVDKEGKLGFRTDTTYATDILEKAKITQEFGFFASIPRGFERTIESLTGQVKQFKIIFNKQAEGYKQVSGPIGIVKMMPTELDWVAFWNFTAMFSVWLAFLNLLPIPGLDGGHVVFTLWEMITGRPAPQKVLEYAQMAGVIFLLGLMILIFGNDIFKFL